MLSLAGFAGFVIGVFSLGFELTRLLLARAKSRASSLERIVFSIHAGIVLWLIAAWSLALTGNLTRPSLLFTGIAALLAAAAMRLARRPAPSRPESERRLLAACAVAPIIVWTFFLLWRGVIAPPLAPDAFTYHLPRAAMIARAAHFEYFPDLRDNRANQLPANYELLVASVMVLEGSDRVTEWISTLMFVLFVLAAAALSRQWWGRGMHNVAVALAVFGMPVLLLQGAMHKNDVMTSVFFLGALLALGRWLESFDWSAALFLGLCTGAAIGTKPQGLLFAAVAFLPFAWGAVRHFRQRTMRGRQLAAVCLIVVLLLPLLGAAAYVVAQEDPRVAVAGGVRKVAPVLYGEWSYLWIAPVVLLVAPFSPHDETVVLPWNGEEWMWERYDPYASNFGGLFTIAALLLPIAVWMFRRQHDELPRYVPAIVTAVACITFFASLPVRWAQYGYISGHPRYFLFMTPLVFAWTLAPALRWSNRMGRTRIGWLLVFVLSLFSAETAMHIARRDKFAPLVDLRWMAERPGTRWVPSMPWRAASVVDERARETDAIDVYAGHDVWIYPAFGETLRRDVRSIDDVSEIRPEADWVIIDRAFSVIWADPNFRHIRDFRKYLGRGTPTEDDLKLIRTLDRDPRFERVSFDPRETQAVYRRKRPPSPTMSRPHGP